MNEETLLPIRPASSSFYSHLSALTDLIGQLEALPTQTRWPAFIPLTSRARLPGQIVHPNEVKVNLGEGWWVEMTAKEAAEYLRRRKTALLEEQARSIDGGKPQNLETAAGVEKKIFPSALPGPVDLNPVLMGFDTSVSSTASAHNSDSVNSSSEPHKHTIHRLSETSESDATTATIPPPASSIPESTPGPATLEQVLDRFVANEKLLSDASGASARDATLTEEGLPIHEIKETPNGEIIGATPEPTAGSVDESFFAEDSGRSVDDYHSDAARARREALFKRVFGGDSDLDEGEDEHAEDAKEAGAREDDEDEENGADDEEYPPRGERRREKLVDALPSGTRARLSPPPISPASSSPPRSPIIDANDPIRPLSRRPSASIPPPSRSILKPPPPQVRKKSVTFDESVPIPPDSPGVARKMGFQLPLPGMALNEMEVEEKKVPFIPEPIPGMKKSGTTAGFAGMKRGFLDPPRKAVVSQAKSEDGKSETTSKKKPSLFAQRLAQHAVRESPINATPTSLSLPDTTAALTNAAAGPSRQNNLPKMSTVTATSTVRPVVIEKPIDDPPPSAPLRNTYPTRDDEDEDGDEEEDDPGFLDDDDSEEEDEYNLDDALLAREVALEYHRRKAYTSPYLSQDPDDPAYGMVPPDEESGGVMLAMPQVDIDGNPGGAPIIVNPTPDDFRRFVRVGKLENGNLVLAPGEEGWSDDEDVDGGDDDIGELEIERRKKRDNRRKVRDVLLGSGESKGSNATVGTQGNSILAGQAATMSQPAELPPVVRDAPKADVTPAVREVKESSTVAAVATVADPPKKVSRFKAARMGGT